MNDDKQKIIGRLLGAIGIIPGGVLPTDHWHHVTTDNTCSRCRKPIADDEVPVMLWRGKGDDMLMYCKACVEAK